MKFRAIWGRAMLTMLVSRVAMKAPKQTVSRMARQFRKAEFSGQGLAGMLLYLTPSRAEVGEDFRGGKNRRSDRGRRAQKPGGRG